jgi:hypothetical protein
MPTSTIVTCAEEALSTIHLVRSHPDQPETVALALDARVGHTIVVVTGTVEPDSVIEVVEVLAESLAATDHPGELVIATVRPVGGPVPGDVDRWIEMSAIAEDRGCELLEWFVLTEAVAWCPRDLLAEPPRW